MNTDNPADLVLEYTLDELEHHASQEISSRLPLEYIQTVPHHDKIDALQACLIVYQLTLCTIVPCVFQLQAVLATLNGRDTIITAGTRSGKTLCQLIPMLL